tara:strand:+ start:205 stop:546 length:342 start_codon:yes stop_codon:yes gene_type:complete
MFYEETPNNSVNLTPVARTTEQQVIVDKETSQMALYHYDACFFSSRVRNVIEILNLTIEMRDILINPKYGQNLLENGGSMTVPCLYDGNPPPSVSKWMYESADIMQYLKERFL